MVGCASVAITLRKEIDAAINEIRAKRNWGHTVRVTIRTGRYMRLGIAATCAVLTASSAHAVGEKAFADIKLRDGRELGRVRLYETAAGILLRVRLKGLPGGVHGFHIHQVGQCAAPDFKSAGPHFNPGQKQHGDLNPLGVHAGDLVNLTVNPEGSGTVNMLAKGATIKAGPNSLMQPGGTSLVIHASADDRKSDPSGNSGERIACGVIQQ